MGNLVVVCHRSIFLSTTRNKLHKTVEYPHHTVTIHTNNTTKHRYKRHEAIWSIYMFSIKYLVGVKVLVISRRARDVHLVHSFNNLHEVLRIQRYLLYGLTIWGGF